jgi:hypothetical protein
MGLEHLSRDLKSPLNDRSKLDSPATTEVQSWRRSRA